MAATPVIAFVIEYIRTIVSGLYVPQVSRKMTLPFRAMRPEAPFSRPALIWSCMTALIRFRRSAEKPAVSGAAVGKPAPLTNDAHKQRTSRIRMSANLSHRAGGACAPSQQSKFCCEARSTVKPRDEAFEENITARSQALARHRGRFPSEAGNTPTGLCAG